MMPFSENSFFEKVLAERNETDRHRGNGSSTLALQDSPLTTAGTHLTILHPLKTTDYVDPHDVNVSPCLELGPYRFIIFDAFGDGIEALWYYAMEFDGTVQAGIRPVQSHPPSLMLKS